jgi:hypothetical protein
MRPNIDQNFMAVQCMTRTATKPLAATGKHPQAGKENIIYALNLNRHAHICLSGDMLNDK